MSYLLKVISVQYVLLQEEPLRGWSLKRNIDGSDGCDFSIPDDVVVNPGDKVKVMKCCLFYCYF